MRLPKIVYPLFFVGALAGTVRAGDGDEVLRRVIAERDNLQRAIEDLEVERLSAEANTKDYFDNLRLYQAKVDSLCGVISSLQTERDMTEDREITTAYRADSLRAVTRELTSENRRLVDDVGLLQGELNLLRVDRGICPRVEVGTSYPLGGSVDYFFQNGIGIGVGVFRSPEDVEVEIRRPNPNVTEVQDGYSEIGSIYTSRTTKNCVGVSLPRASIDFGRVILTGSFDFVKREEEKSRFDYIKHVIGGTQIGYVSENVQLKGKNSYDKSLGGEARYKLGSFSAGFGYRNGRWIASVGKRFGDSRNGGVK